jgi:hypothetical protein
VARRVKRNAVQRVKDLAVNYYAAKANIAERKRNANLFLTGAAAAASTTIPGFGVVAAGYLGAAAGRHMEMKAAVAKAISREDALGRKMRLAEFRARLKKAKDHPGTQRDVKDAEGTGVVKAHERRSKSGRRYMVRSFKRRGRK